MSEPIWQPRTDTAARLLGAAFFVSGGLGLNWQVLGTLRDAEEGLPELRYSMLLILFSVLWTMMGAWWLLRGLAGYFWVRKAQHEPRARMILTLATFVLSLFTWLAMRMFLTRLGYTE